MPSRIIIVDFSQGARTDALLTMVARDYLKIGFMTDGAIPVKRIMLIADYAFVLLKTITWEGTLNL